MTKSNIIDLETRLQEMKEQMRREEILVKHPYKIYQGKDGYWYTYLPDDEKKRVFKKKKNKKDIQKIVIDYWKTQEYNPTIEAIFNEWNDRRLKLQKIAKSTHQRNKQVYNRHYKEFGKKRISKLEAVEYVNFLEEQIAYHSLTAKSFSLLKGITSGYLLYAKRKKLIDFNVADMFEQLDTNFSSHYKEDSEEVFDECEMEMIMEYLYTNEDTKNLGLMLLFVSGLRIGELVALKREDIEEQVIKVRRTEIRYKGEDGKNVYAVRDFPKTKAGIREVVIPETYLWLLKKIKRINPFGEYVFINQKGERMTTNCFRRRLEQVCDRLQIKRRSPHKIRKTYGSILLDYGVDNRMVIGQMGHTNVICTETHYHRNRRSIDSKVDILNNIPEFGISSQKCCQ